MSEIEEIKKDLGYMFKWLSLQIKIAQIREHKNCSIKQQDFEKALKNREEEVSVFNELTKVSDELHEISKKYI